MAHSGVSYLLRCLQADSQSNTTGSTDWRLYQQTVSTDRFWCSLYSFFFFFFIESVKENNTFMDNHLSKLHVQGLSWKTNVVLGCMDKRVFIERKMILSLNLALCVLGGQHKRILLFNPDIRWGWINRGKTDLRQCGILCLTLLKRDLHFYLWIQL